MVASSYTLTKSHGYLTPVIPKKELKVIQLHPNGKAEVYLSTTTYLTNINFISEYAHCMKELLFFFLHKQKEKCVHHLLVY